MNYVMAPGARLFIGPDGKPYESVGHTMALGCPQCGGKCAMGAEGKGLPAVLWIALGLTALIMLKG
jgi:hypothetical protein